LDSAADWPGDFATFGVIRLNYHVFRLLRLTLGEAVVKHRLGRRGAAIY